MSENRPTWITFLRKTVKYLSLTILTLLIIANLFILISGRTYLYKGVYNTYLQGRTAPGIFDKDVFFNATLHKSTKSLAWKHNTAKVKPQLTVTEIAALEKLDISSFLVFHGDTLIYEKYWGKHTPQTVTNSFSAAKSFVGLLIGCALGDGKIKSLDESVGNYIPAFSKGKKKAITIRHLLMMSAGLDWEESGKNPLSDNAESYYGTDLYTHVTSQEAIEKPGVRFEYQSGNSELLGFIIEKATGKQLSQYAEEKIWKKIGTEHDAYWSLDKEKGDEKSFCCLYSTSRDFARLGKLINSFGKWNDDQVVPEAYMKEFVSNPTMTTEDKVPNYRYGLHIWTYLGDKQHPVYYCRGILGQFIISIPSKNLVIVRTGSKRGKNIFLPEEKEHDKAFIEKYKYKFGHPDDLFTYLKIGKRMVK